MNIYKITRQYHVTGILKPESVGQLKRLGIVKVICNHPDSEAPFEDQSEHMRLAITEAGMAFDYNPVTMISFSPELVRRQTDAVLNTNGGVLPIVPRDGAAPCYGRLNLHTNAHQRM